MHGSRSVTKNEKNCMFCFSQNKYSNFRGFIKNKKMKETIIKYIIKSLFCNEI